MPSLINCTSRSLAQYIFDVPHEGWAASDLHVNVFVYFSTKKKKKKRFKGKMNFSETCVRGKAAALWSVLSLFVDHHLRQYQKLISYHYGNFTSSVETYLEMATYLTEGLLLHPDGCAFNQNWLHSIGSGIILLTLLLVSKEINLSRLVNKTKGKHSHAKRRFRDRVINNRHVKIWSILLTRI